MADRGQPAGLVVAAVGAFVGFRSPASTAAIHDRAAGRRYGVIVAIEFGLAGLGAGILGAIGQAVYVPVWVCAVVGVQLLPLAPLLRDRRLVALGVLITIVAVMALVAGLTHTVSPSTVTGVGAGLLLLTFAIAELAGALRQGGGPAASG
jgi:hypothetical protein